MCSRYLPGKIPPLSEIIMPALGTPIALILSIVSFPQSSNLRRAGLAIIIFVSGLMIFSLISALLHR